MRAVVVDRSEAHLVDDLELEPPRSGEVEVSVRRCGVCLTDLHLAQGLLEFPRPVVCGHEVAGVVRTVGPGVLDVAPGDPVIVSCRPACRSCVRCIGGQPHLCERSLMWATGVRSDGTSPLRWHDRRVALGVGVGGFAERLVAPAAAVVPIDADVPLDLAAVLGCAVLTGAGAVLNTARVEPGETVLVVGLGGVGLAAVLAARACAATVLGVDPRRERRDAAAAAGAVCAEPAGMAELVAELTGGGGVDTAIDCVGDTGSSIPAAFDSLRPGGHLVIAGVPPSGAQLTLPAGALVSEERRVSGCFLGSSDPARDIPRLLSLWRTGRLDLSALVTQVLPLDELPKVLMSEDTPAGIRTVVDMERGRG